MLPTILERFPAAFVQILVLDLLADLLAHVVAGHLGGKRQARFARPGHQLGHRAELMVDAQARQRDVHAQRAEHVVHARHQLLEIRVIAGRKAQQADFVEPGAAVTVERGLHDGFDGAHAQRPFDGGRLTEAALPGAAAHDFDADAIVGHLHERHDRLGGQRNRVEILVDRAGHDRLRHVGPRTVHRGNRAVGVILRLVEHRRVRPIGRADDLGDHVRAGKLAFLFERHPLFHQPGQALFAVADDENVHERRQHFGVLRAGAAGDHQRMVERAVLAE